MITKNRLDPVTGLFTRETLDFLFGFELTRQRRYPSPLALLRMGISLDDNFPDDAQTLSNVRIWIAGLLNANLREADVPAHDKDDFLILLPETDVVGAKAVGLRLLLRLHESHMGIARLDVKPVSYIGMTWSAGEQDIPAETLMDQASAALRAAKRRGPFNLVCFDELGKG